MGTIFFLFSWLERQAGTSEIGIGAVKYAAWSLDSHALWAVGLLLIVALSSIPKEGIATFLAAVVYTMLAWLHFDAAYWRGNLPETNAEIVLTTLSVVIIPSLSFMVTQWAWRARHS